MGENSCIVCRAASNRRCSACGTATYCSPKHQKEDWKHHRPNCKIYKIAKNDKVGRHLIATRTITEGTIIFDEAPIVVGPKIYSLPICLGCYKRVNGSYFCTRCGYPMCSAECESVSISNDVKFDMEKFINRNFRRQCIKTMNAKFFKEKVPVRSK